MHAQEGLLHQALGVGADGTGPVARLHALTAGAHPAAAVGGGVQAWAAPATDRRSRLRIRESTEAVIDSSGVLQMNCFEGWVVPDGEV
jgi:hypothetical protein